MSKQILYCPEKSIFEHDKNTWLVNPVNCVGVMGKGLALEFKKRYPAMCAQYKEDCLDGTWKPGEVLGYTQWNIYCFPTKFHWKDPSKLEWVRIGLCNLLEEYPTHSIAFPKLGCGLGGLAWKDVHEYIRAFALLAPCETVYIHGEKPNE